MTEQRFRLWCGYVIAKQVESGALNDWTVTFHDEDGRARWVEWMPASMFESVFAPIDEPIDQSPAEDQV